MKLSTVQRPLIEQNKINSFETKRQVNLQPTGKYQNMVRQMAQRIKSCNGIGSLTVSSRKRAQVGLLTELLLVLLPAALLMMALGSAAQEGGSEQQEAAVQQVHMQIPRGHHHHHQQHQHHHNHHQQHQLAAERRAGGLEPGDYIDEAGELDVMVNQQQIPTAHLMAAAGHIVPENFFLPGGSIPAGVYSRYVQSNYNHQNQHQHQHQHQHQQQQREHYPSGETLQQLASQVQARFLAPHKYIRSAELLAVAASQESPQQQPAAAAISPKEAQQEAAALIDLNPYSLMGSSAASEPREAGSAISQADLIEYLTSAAAQNAIFEQQQAQSQQQAQQLSREQQLVEQQLAAELAALASQQAAHQHQHQQHSHQQQQAGSGSLYDNSLADQNALASDQYQHIGPAYQIMGHNQDAISYAYEGQPGKEGGKPFGLPTKSSHKEPSGMLKPLGNPKTVSSPVIDFVTNQLPKTTVLEKINDKIPQTQTPTVFSFSSSKDPVGDKAKGINQKKRTVMRQAEQIAKMMIKTINDKFGTNLGDQSDIPFLLSSIGPLGFAQNILADPTLLVTLLNSAEKTYLSDVLPGPAKMAIRPVLNIFRVPNKKRDKANLSNIISFLASGGQTSSSAGGSKQRQGMGVEKQSSNSKNKSKR